MYAKNITTVAEWFHLNTPLLANPKGFDLYARTFGIWDDEYKKMPCNYGWRCEMNFDFQLFLSSSKGGGKWTVEPPHYSFYINNTESGHGTNFHLPGWDNTKDPPSLEAPLEKATGKLNSLFAVFPLIKEVVTGIWLYGDGNLIVFNPNRPPFWISVTLRELSVMHLEYYKLKNKTEIDKMMLDQLKKEIAELSEEELNAPAFEGHDSHFVLKANGKSQGLQLMRFNPEYWDRSLPPSAIQFMTLYYPESNQNEANEYLKNNGHPNYSRLLTNSLKMEALGDLIKRSK